MSVRTLVQRVAQVGLGLSVAFLLAEVAFYARDDGAFPHVNFYLPDPELGVRLRPGASERISFGGNPVHTARVNIEGYRGEDWGEPKNNTTSDEVVVIGDSQVFGLGVEETETASAVLEGALNRTVRNAGVPTYGPPEYLTLLKELLADRHPKTVVVVLNFANDLFEIQRANRDRHRVWDGWAVRIETAPQSIFDFPGRSLLFSESHLVYAARQWLYTPWDPEDRGLPSEGGLADLVLPPASEAADDVELAARAGQLARARSAAEVKIEQLYLDIFGYGDDYDNDLKLRAVREHATPGDIVGEYESESSRAIDVTAEFLRQASTMRRELEPKLVQWASEHPEDPRAASIQRLLAERTESAASLESMSASVAHPRWSNTPFAGFMTDAQAACQAAGAELAIVALPLDVQVSQEEWAKYDKPVVDMTETVGLLDDAVSWAHSRGIRAMNATSALQEVGPGAFLHADIHMSPRGQSAFGLGIAKMLAEPAPVPTGSPGLPPGRTRVPSLDELTYATEITVRGSTKNHCSTRQLREWLFVDCNSGYHNGATVVLQSGSLETMSYIAGQKTGLLTPLTPGVELRARFEWVHVPEGAEGPWRDAPVQDLVLGWKGQAPDFRFEPASGPLPKAVAERESARASIRKAIRKVAPFYVPYLASPACVAQYPKAEDLRACITGTRAAIATCPPGQIPAGSGAFCSSVCATDADCTEGSCLDWQGVRVCR